MKSALGIVINQSIFTPTDPKYNLVSVNKHSAIANKSYLDGSIVLAGINYNTSLNTDSLDMLGVANQHSLPEQNGNKHQNIYFYMD